MCGRLQAARLWFLPVLGGACGDDPIATDVPDVQVADLPDGERDICQRALDLDAYTAPPVRLTFAATPECPPLADPLILDVPVGVPITGVVRLSGVPTFGVVKLHGRSGEGDVEVFTEGDGSFATVVFAGHYDVSVGRLSGPVVYPYRTVMTDVTIAGPDDLLLDAPAPVRFQGALTLDGAQTADYYAYVMIRELGAKVEASRLGRLRDGIFDINIGPGTYEILYTVCDYEAEGPHDHPAPFCHGDGGPVGGAPLLAPSQVNVLLRELTIAADTTLDLDVQTARLTGRVQIDGAPPPDLWHVLSLVSSNSLQPDVRLALDGGLDVRLIRHTYAARIGGSSGPLVSEFTLDGDRNLELNLQTIPVRGEHPPLPWSIEPQKYRSGPRLELRAKGSDYAFHGPEAPPAAFQVQMVAGIYQAAYHQPLCWPDNPHLVQDFSTIVARDLHLYEPVTLDLEVELVRLALDLTGDGHLEFIPAGDTALLYGPDWRFDAGRLAGHGTMVPGRYDVWFDGSWIKTIEVVDGMTITGAPFTIEPQPMLRIGGVRQDPQHQLAFTPTRLRFPERGDSERIYDNSLFRFKLPVGSHEVWYVGGADGAPSNRLRLGCVTVPAN